MHVVACFGSARRRRVRNNTFLEPCDGRGSLMGHVEREFLTPAETGRILGLGEQTVLMHTRAGNLHGTNVARPGSKRERWRYTLKDIEIFRQRRQFKASDFHSTTPEESRLQSARH